MMRRFMTAFALLCACAGTTLSFAQTAAATPTQEPAKPAARREERLQQWE